MLKPIWILLAVMILCAIGYWNYRRFVPKPQAVGSKKYGVQKRALHIPAGSRELFGELLLPTGIDGKLPTVICSHGLNSNGKNMENLVGLSLAMSGFAVICFDFWGGSMRSASGGEMWKMSVFTEQEDLNSVIDFVKGLPSTDPEKLFLLGESQGGFVTAITAAQRPQDIRAVVEYYPAFCIPDDARKRHGNAANIPERETLGASELGRVYSEKLMDYDVYQVLPGYTGPVLIIHGDADQIVNISYGRKAAEAYRQAEFVSLPGEIHGFKADGKRKAAKLSYAFLLKNADSEEKTKK